MPIDPRSPHSDLGLEESRASAARVSQPEVAIDCKRIDIAPGSVRRCRLFPLPSSCHACYFQPLSKPTL